MQSNTTSDEEDDEDPPEAPAPSVLLNPPPAALKRKEPPSGEAQNHKKAVKSSQPVSLPQPLDTALLEHVELEVSNDPTTGVAKTDMSNRPIMKAISVMGVDLTKIKLVFIHMLCSQWRIKKYRQASRVKCLKLITHHQLLGSYYHDQAKDVKLTNEEIQGSKMRLLNVIFSEAFFSDVVTMNDSKGRAKLDAGKTGGNGYGVQSWNPTTMQQIMVYEQLTWVKAEKWFKKTVKDYDRFMVEYTASGQVQPDFHSYVEGKNHVYYYCLFIEEKPETHKSLTSVLNDELFSEWTKKLGTEGNKDSSLTKNLKATQVVLQAVADSMTDSRSHQMKRDEKMSLDNEIGQIHMNLLKLPSDASGDPV